MAMEKLVERVDFSYCDYYESSHKECLTAFFDKLMENFDQIRIAIFCGDYPNLGNFEVCNAWNGTDSVEGLADYFEDIDDENIEDEYDENISKYEISDEFRTEIPTEVTEVAAREGIFTQTRVDTVLTGIAATVIFIVFILAIVWCVRLCRNNVYKKYAILDKEYPGRRIAHI